MPRTLVVMGDVLKDHHIYSGERNTPLLGNRRGLMIRRDDGGAILVHQLIEAVLERDQPRPGHGDSVRAWIRHLRHSGSSDEGFAQWAPVPRGPKDEDKKVWVWRATQKMGYGTTPECDHPKLPAILPVNEDTSVPPCSILVLDDAGLGFRRRCDKHYENLIGSVAEGGFILLKMSGRAGREGPENLLRVLSRRSSSDPDSSVLQERKISVVGLVSARDLRRETVGIDRGLSWESALDDLRTSLSHRRETSFLHQCDHLIVTFSSDAAVWIKRRKKKPAVAHAWLDTLRGEGEWAAEIKGEVIGYHVAMTAALVLGLVRHLDTPGDDLDLGVSVNAGLVAMRQLLRIGHGVVTNSKPAGYPHADLAKWIVDVCDGRATPPDRFRKFDVPWPPQLSSVRDGWSLIVEHQRQTVPRDQAPLLHLAQQVVRYGPIALDHVPHAHFRKFITADRDVIETLRYLRRQMNNYKAKEKPEAPLSIAVFGPPGAGKSFGVRQLAEEVFGEESWRAFNLSQFKDSAELNNAFHQVRDFALRGITPVVLWDAFDSREWYWLQYLLAPMQDGRFQDEQIHYRIGKCVFVFAGGTSSSFQEFKDMGGSNAGFSTEAARKFRLLKGPDFVSRLDGYMDVVGPNPRPARGRWRRMAPNSEDHLVPLRRALMIRHHLDCKETDLVDFDDGLLDALLTVPAYHNGARSLEKLIEAIRGEDRTVVRRSGLPRSAQLSMHVDADRFLHIMEGRRPAPTWDFTWSDICKMASILHERWRERQDWSSRRDGFLNVPYGELRDPYKHTNRAAVSRMPMILDLAGLKISATGSGFKDAQAYRDHIESIGDYLYEVEHNGWVSQRVASGWRFDPVRNDADGRHPAMVPYAQLSERQQRNDRGNVLSYYDICEAVGLHIERKPRPWSSIVG